MAVQTKEKPRAKRKGDGKGKGKSKGKSKGKRKARRKQPPQAKRADKLDLYERSVQGPEEDSRFFARYYKKYVGRPATTFREDFCGTATLACRWVELKPHHRAIGVDIHGPTLDWGRERHVAALSADQQRRIKLVQDDVRAVNRPKADIACALNFSYCVFKTRDELRAYFANAYRSLAPDGLFFVDAWGGSETQVEQTEEREIDGEFTYVWDQHRFDPLTYETTCKIHFEFGDGSRLDDAFVYEWRLWTLPEIRELLLDVGFEDVHVLWEGTDHKTGEGNGIFRRVDQGDADDAWIAYVVGRR